MRPERRNGRCSTVLRPLPPAAIFGGLGTVFAAIGDGLLFAWFRRRAIIARLRASGLPIQAKFLACYRDTSVRVNGRSPFRVVCQATHPGTGKLQSFKSDPIWIDVTDRLAGGEVRVFVDPARPRHHWVDLSPIVDESDMGWGRVGHRTRNATSRNWTK